MELKSASTGQRPQNESEHRGTVEVYVRQVGDRARPASVVLREQSHVRERESTGPLFIP